MNVKREKKHVSKHAIAYGVSRQTAHKQEQAKMWRRKLWSIVEGKLNPLVINLFHIIYHKSKESWSKNTFLGYQVMQCPFDLYLYQELVVKLRPPFILQTGVFGGGSILYLASLLDLIGADPSAIAVGVDITLTPEARSLSHPRIHLIEGSSTDSQTVERICGGSLHNRFAKCLSRAATMFIRFVRYRP